MKLLDDFDNWSMSTFIVRWIAGVLYLMQGYWKVFEFTAIEHARQFFVEAYAGSWIPAWLLWIIGLVIPYIELIGGILLLVGFRVRVSASVLGAILIITTYGHALKQPLFDISGHTFTRLALLIFLLLAPAGRDVLTVDYWLSHRQGKSAKQPAGSHGDS